MEGPAKPAKAKPDTRPAAVDTRRDGEGTPLMANGQPNPTGVGRYCLTTGTCHCGRCDHYYPPPLVDAAPIIARLQRTQVFLPPVAEPED